MASKVRQLPTPPLRWSSLLARLGSGPGLAGYPHPSDHAACVLLQSKKNVVVAETPSAVLPNLDGTLDESVASKKTDSILRAATQDLLTLMKLDVRDPAASSGWGGIGGASACPEDPVLRSPASSGDPAATSGWGGIRGASACPGEPVLGSPASSGDPAAASGWGGIGGASACPGDPVLGSPASSGSCSRVGVAVAAPSPGQGSGRHPDGPDAGVPQTPSQGNLGSLPSGCSQGTGRHSGC